MKTTRHSGGLTWQSIAVQAIGFGDNLFFEVVDEYSEANVIAMLMWRMVEAGS